MTETLQTIELDDLSPAPAHRARLACYLELPSVQQIDPITDAEIRELDEQRHHLLSIWARAIDVPIDHITDSRIELRIAAPTINTRTSDKTAIDATAPFANQLIDARADSLVIAAFSLGGRVDQIIKAHLDREEIYEAFLLKQWSATMAEQARAELTRRLRARVRRQGRSLMPYDGPGYNGWPLASLAPLLGLIPNAQVRVTDSGVLLPTNSMVIVHGVSPIAPTEPTPSLEIPRGENPRDEQLAQCHRCAMRNCRYRTMEPIHA
jgi:hypothetical protein